MLRLCISLVVLLVLSGVFYKCKWRHGLIVEEEKSSFNVIKYFGLFSPTSLNDAILFYIMMWEPNPHIPLDPGRESELTHPLTLGTDTDVAIHFRILSQSQNTA